ncbi:PepSY-associated TM helix [Sphingopyxis sp. LC81]|uniref:PepSY-associated TM helix domain-containing protein n=1 Tax=Sphingopyxis sp. LC81 TaxID=1502850 RepID=UPI00050FC4C9|nr:PepSY-associated TM helix domain-containing protein [Sphingopyxis sp. LC81]KGB54992.1 PepSY-associated TM helix [Sphingopyxis sp. LC81]
MRMIDLLHRWTGGLIGLLLALIGLSGALLAHADSLLTPVGQAPSRNMALPDVVAEALRDPAPAVDYIIFASTDLPLHRIIYSDGSGRYVDTGGVIVDHWQSQWERPELWLFDFHRHLFMGKGGETVTGIAALIGIAFVVSGALLWWQRRYMFAPRLWPVRMTEPAILRHHRDLGVLLAPLLILSFVTGAMMALKPVGLALVSPWSSASEIAAATAGPTTISRLLAAPPDWHAMVSEARRRFPDAEIRLIGFPARPGDPILIRMRRPGEWLPNGRTSLWFASEGGHLVKALDADTLPAGAKILDRVYPLHAAKVGGFFLRLAMTISGLGLTLLGSLAVWSFWIKRAKRSNQHLRSS